MPRDFAQSSTQYLASIDAEIERLQNLREQVAAAVEADEAIAKPAKSARKGMSAAGRRRVAEAQKARWAKQKRTTKATTKAAKRSASRKAPAKKATATQNTGQA